MALVAVGRYLTKEWMTAVTLLVKHNFVLIWHGNEFVLIYPDGGCDAATKFFVDIKHFNRLIDRYKEK